MSSIKNKTVLITGGASGIGKLVGELCLKQGAKRLLILDIDETKLTSTVAEFTAQGYEAEGYITDLTDGVSIEDAARQIIAAHGGIDLLFNNAGIVIGKLFEEHTSADIQKTLAINVEAVMQVTRLLLPSMIARKSGHIINIASAAGLTPNPRMSVYAASKWAVLGWSESLRLEMESNHPGIHVTTIAPSYINTGMFEGARAPMLTPILEPDFMARRIVEAVNKNEIMVMEPASVHLLPALRGLLPTRVFDFVADHVFGVYHTMDEFKGRKG